MRYSHILKHFPKFSDRKIPNSNRPKILKKDGIRQWKSVYR